jgi:nucleoside-diphosphate-sugar epimerase
LTPQSTYGTTKAILELLVNDYTRRGVVDGRVARLPTVIIRPGAANAAASSVASAVFREPLKGLEYAVPVSLDTSLAVTGVRTVVEGLIALHEADGRQLGSDRAVSFPSTDYSIEQMIASLERVAGGRSLGPIGMKLDPVVQSIVSSWPRVVDADRASSVGVPAPDELDDIVRSYIDESHG